MDHTFLYRKVNKKGGVTQPIKTLPKETGLKCDECGLIVAKESQLEVHIRIKHEDNANFKCEQCIFKCRNESQLQEHIKNKHHVPCTKFEKTFVSQNALKKHRKDHAIQQVAKEKKITRIAKQKNVEHKEEKKSGKPNETSHEIEEEEDGSSESIPSESETSVLASIYSSLSDSSFKENSESGEEEEY